MGEKGPAADDYETAIEKTDLHGAEAVEARKHLDALSKDVGVVAITSPEGSRIRVAHVEGAPSPVRVHLTPGEYEVVVEDTAGARRTRKVVVAAGDSLPITFTFEPASPPSAPSSVAQTAASARHEPPALVRTGASQRAAGWIVLGIGVAAGAAAAV